MKRRFLSVLLLSLAALAAPCSPALAAPAAKASSSAPANDLPIHITSDTMTYDTAKNMVVFKGNVEVVRENFNMWSAVLTLYLKEGGQQAPKEEGAAPALETGDLDHIVAEKNVRFTYNNQNGTAEKATYTVDNSLLLLEGNPVVRDGENSVTGERIRYYMNENRSEVDGGPQKRVQAVFGGSKKGK